MDVNFGKERGNEMDCGQLRELAYRWELAVNAHDVEGLLTLYADDIVHISPRIRQLHPDTEGVIRGKDALRKWLQECFTRHSTLQYKIRSWIASAPGRMLTECHRVGDGEPMTDVAVVFEVNDAGRIQHSQTYLG